MIHDEASCFLFEAIRLRWQQVLRIVPFHVVVETLKQPNLNNTQLKQAFAILTLTPRK
jgi:hypothetical protein